MDLGSLVNLQFLHKLQDHRGVSTTLLGALNAQWVLLIFSTVVATICTFRSYGFSKRPKAPIVGYRSWIEPAFVLRGRFFLEARQMVADGYSKVENLILSKSNRSLIFPSSKMACSGYEATRPTFSSYRENT